MKLFNSKYILTGILTMMSILHLYAQTVVSGKVVNTKREPIAAASIRVKESNIGANADSLGIFFFEHC